MSRNYVGDVEGSGIRISMYKGPVVRESTSEEQREGQDGWGLGIQGENGARRGSGSGPGPAH